MNRLERFFYKEGYLSLSEKRLSKWHEAGDFRRLIFASQKGTYTLRLQSISLLTQYLKEEEVKHRLIDMIDDSVEAVALAAMEVFKGTRDKAIQARRKAARDKWKAWKKTLKNAPGPVSIMEQTSGWDRPSDRLMGRLKDQQDTNHPPFGF